MEEVSGFGMKSSLTLPSSAKKSSNSLRDEYNESIYTYKDKNMRYIVRQSIKGGRCLALNQCHKSILSDNLFNIVSKHLGGDGTVCKILEKHFDFTNKLKNYLKLNLIRNLKTIEMSTKIEDQKILTINIAI